MSFKTFHLYCNHKTYEFPLDKFRQVSKRCAALVKNGDYQGTINHPVSEEAFEAFSSACQLKDFQTTQTNAFELLDLAQEWGIKSLETFVSNYINAKGLKRPEEGDHLTPLLEHLEEEDDNYDNINDVIGIAKRFDEYLQDDRLLELHPETIFQIYHHAEFRGVDQKKYADFVLNQFEKDPEKAVPLSLLMNFDLLNNRQVEDIFQCRDMHEEFIGYFIAHALSTLRGKSQRDIDDMEERNLKEIDNIRDSMKKLKNESLGKLQNQFQTDIDAVRESIDKQGEEIKALKELKKQQQKKIDAAKQKFEQQEAQIQKEIDSQKNRLAQIQWKLKLRKNNISDEIKEQTDTFKYTISEKAAEIGNNDKARTAELATKVAPIADQIKEKSDELLEQDEIVKEKTNSDVYWTKTVQATFAAKVVHDQLRFDHFLRDVSKRFEVFNTEPKIWDLDIGSIKQAEETVNKLEKKVNSSCPISARQQIAMSVNVMNQFANLFSGGKS